MVMQGHGEGEAAGDKGGSQGWERGQASGWSEFQGVPKICFANPVQKLSKFCNAGGGYWALRFRPRFQ